MKKILIASLIGVLFYFSSLFAQNPPPGQEPGAQAERFRKESEQKKEGLEKKPVKAPEIEVQKEPEKPMAEGISFVLKEVKITGATIFKPADFRSIYQPYLDKKITFKDIETIIEKIKAKYKEKGYLTTTAYLPEQEIKEGKIEIRIVEGKMGKVKIEGNKWFSSALLEKYLQLKKMKS